MNLQDEAKKLGHPWFLAKGFDSACPVSSCIPRESVPNPHNLDLWCRVNWTMKQRGNTRNLIFRIPTLLEYVSRYVRLDAGDVLLTGTPEGVGPVVGGDVLECGLGDRLARMQFTVEA